MASIERKELLEKIQTVFPALADNERIQVLTHLCFTGDKLMAFNDRIAISTPLSTEFKGTLPGALLRDLVNIQVHANKVTISPTNDNNIQVVMGKSKIKLATFPVKLFTQLVPTDFVAPARSTGMDCDATFFEAIDDCMQSVETNAVIKDKLGITVIPDARELRLYSTNGQTLTRATLPAPDTNPFKERIILSSEFCKEVLANRTSEKTKLDIRKDHSLFIAGDTHIFGRLIRSDTPLDMEELVRKLTSNTKIPKVLDKERDRLGTAIKLAQRMSEIVTNEAMTEVAVTNGEVQFSSASQRGEITDKVPFNDHPNSNTKVIISYIAKQYDRYSSLLFKERVCVMSKKNTIFMVSAHG